ncbi:MAG TPA: FAD-dependent oxidoreductase [Burkholderiaceae bacterium]|nr:FAD-dependent oxidoreductase [Burkholderiaceae bacterium]
MSAVAVENRLKLQHGLQFADLYRRDGLQRIDDAFVARVAAQAPDLAARLREARAAAPATHDGGSRDAASRAEASLLLDLAPHVDRFIAELFDIAADFDALQARHADLEALFQVKSRFVRRQAAVKFKATDLEGFDADAARATLNSMIGIAAFDELAFARAVVRWQGQPEAHAEQLDAALRYAAWAVHTPEGQRRHARDVLFGQPHRIDPLHLLEGHVEENADSGTKTFRIVPHDLRHRDGFGLTDPGMDLRGALDQAHYCIGCHEQGKDSCSQGLVDAKASRPGNLAFRASAFGVPLAGCPLEERISEFLMAKARGQAIAALALITIDNPLVAATGHRICNDCMKSCIYQKQTPVDIPQAETRVLKDVLELPWGFEIYSLLTRWNPLNLRRPLPRPGSGRTVLVVGQGPAGYSLAHHLLNDGHTVVGIDGLKIEPLDPTIGGVTPAGERVAFAPVRDIGTLREPLDERVLGGFGGVAEYGITVRWDKNFLKVVRLLLQRREGYALYGGVRFGGTLTLADAFELGFDHVALALGAGKPTTLDIPNGLARGVRMASDFLMALQLTGAAKADSIANLQIRLPVVVIGGGLTAIDAATEAAAYYIKQVEKFRARFERLARDTGAAAARAGWSDEEAAVGEEYLAHARELQAEREAATREGRAPRFAALLDRWGGVRIAYRRRLIDSPAYTLNHEEVGKALEEGVQFAECLAPTRIDVDAYGAATSITLARQQRGEDGRWSAGDTETWPARTILIAAGTSPNTVLAREDPTHFVLDGKYFRAVDDDGAPVKPATGHAKPPAAQVLLARHDDGRMVSFFGDLHPTFYGNVVKAMASAQRGYPVVSRVLARRSPVLAEPFDAFRARLDDLLRPRVERVERLTPTIVEVVVRAPMAARRFEPGQFYRLQNFEALAPRPAIEGLPTRLQMEGVALTGAWVDRDRGLVSTIVLEMGGSADLCSQMKPGEPIVLMGPTGTPTEVPGGETVLLAGGGLGNAVLFSIGAALRRNGSRVLYFAGYKKVIDRYKVAEIEAAADVVVWCCDEAPGFSPGRAQDRSFVGNIVDAMVAYASGALGAVAIPTRDVDRLIAIGSDRMMAAVGKARHGVLAPHLKQGHCAIGSINSPMQCMMKEICAQCLQPQRDPQTGREMLVFSCFNQDQPLDRVDFDALRQRLAQNSLQEKLTARWLAARHA